MSSVHADPTRAFHVCLYGLSIECFLFFAAVTQSRMQDPYAHGGVAVTFSVLFLLQSLAALFVTFASQFSGDTLQSVMTTLSALALCAVIILAVFSTGTVVVPESRYRRWKYLVTFLSFVVLMLSSWIFAPMYAFSMDLPQLSAAVQRHIVGGIVGACVALVLASYARIVRPPRQMKGKSGAAVLAFGALVVLGGVVQWMYLRRRCYFHKGVLAPGCPMPKAFDHNTLFATFGIVANILIAEGVLRLMAAGTGTDAYIQI